MISESPRSRNPAGHAGLLENLLALLTALAEFFESRFAHLAGVSWPWIALAAAAVHFIIALILLLVARSRITKPLFRTTLAELKKDREWLKNLDATNQSTS